MYNYILKTDPFNPTLNMLEEGEYKLLILKYVCFALGNLLKNNAIIFFFEAIYKQHLLST